jgi:GNAT superfamily N-acetyltransferase
VKPLTKLTVRHATPEDIESLVVIWLEMQISHEKYDSRYYMTLPDDKIGAMSRSYFIKLMTQRDCIFLVAELEGEIVGMLMSHVVYRPPIYFLKRAIAIEIAAVKEGHQGKGVFKSMLAHLEMLAKQRAIILIELTVHHMNDARTAYQHAGFEDKTVSMSKWLA